MSKRVSVLITAYNGARYLPETIDSILSQTYAPSEVIVVDDGSKDDTREAVTGFGDRVRYQYKENSGVCGARNLAVELLSPTAEYVAFCDQDDLWRADKLAQQMELHERNPALKYSFTNFCYMYDDVWEQRSKLDEAPADFFREGLPPGSAAFEYEGSLYDQILTYQPIWPSTIVLEREFLRGIGEFSEEFNRNPSEDFEFTLRCVKVGPIGVVREPVVAARRHSANFSGDVDRNTRGQIEVLRYVLKHHPIGDATRRKILEQIDVRSVELSYGAFRKGNFGEVALLLGGVPSSYLDGKSRLKLLVSRLPGPLAKGVHKLMVK